MRCRPRGSEPRGGRRFGGSVVEEPWGCRWRHPSQLIKTGRNGETVRLDAPEIGAKATLTASYSAILPTATHWPRRLLAGPGTCRLLARALAVTPAAPPRTARHAWIVQQRRPYRVLRNSCRVWTGRRKTAGRGSSPTRTTRRRGSPTSADTGHALPDEPAPCPRSPVDAIPSSAKAPDPSSRTPPPTNIMLPPVWRQPDASGATDAGSLWPMAAMTVNTIDQTRQGCWPTSVDEFGDSESTWSNSSSRERQSLEASSDNRHAGLRRCSDWY